MADATTSFARTCSAFLMRRSATFHWVINSRSALSNSSLSMNAHLHHSPEGDPKELDLRNYAGVWLLLFQRNAMATACLCSISCSSGNKIRARWAEMLPRANRATVFLTSLFQFTLLFDIISTDADSESESARKSRAINCVTGMPTPARKGARYHECYGESITATRHV